MPHCQKKASLSRHFVSNPCLVFLQPASASEQSSRPEAMTMARGFDVCWPPPGPRTYSAYDCEDGRPYYNLRSVKWGPKGSVWEMQFVRVVGPPVEERRRGIGCCWLCNATLNVQERKWTRPGWTRVVSCGRRVLQLPYERAGASVENNRNRFRKPMIVYLCDVRTKEEPSSQLDMTIYSCPNGCDADDTLQPLLDQKDHTGPARGPRR